MPAIDVSLGQLGSGSILLALALAIYGAVAGVVASAAVLGIAIHATILWNRHVDTARRLEQLGLSQKLPADRTRVGRHEALQQAVAALG